MASLDSIQRFVKEALPVLETKHLTETLLQTAHRDELTRIYNRRYLEETKHNLLALVKRRSSTLGVLMCDIDRFKEVNDTHGHAAGDVVLRDVARIFQTALRTSDLLIRYGGEGFLILLNDVEDNGAMEVAERIRAAVEKYRFQAGGMVLQKTISIGVAELPNDTDVFEACIGFADSAMYQAKDQGRNRVVRYQPEASDEASLVQPPAMGKEGSQLTDREATIA